MTDAKLYQVLASNNMILASQMTLEKALAFIGDCLKNENPRKLIIKEDQTNVTDSD